jgi:hypothetical protein
MSSIIKIYSIKFTLLISLIGVISCNKELEISDPINYHPFASYADFTETLSMIARVEGEDERSSQMDQFWDSLVVNHQIPFVMNDSVALLFQSNGDDVSWAGDFNGWRPNWKGTKIGLSDVHMYETTLPPMHDWITKLLSEATGYSTRTTAMYSIVDLVPTRN